VRMSSLPPHATTDFTPEQVKALYPSDLTLQYVQIFFRHGLSLMNHSQNMSLTGWLQANEPPSDRDSSSLASRPFGTSARLPMNSDRRLLCRRGTFVLFIIVEKLRSQSRQDDSSQSLKVGNAIGPSSTKTDTHAHTSPEM